MHGIGKKVLTSLALSAACAGGMSLIAAPLTAQGPGLPDARWRLVGISGQDYPSVSVSLGVFTETSSSEFDLFLSSWSVAPGGGASAQSLPLTGNYLLTADCLMLAELSDGSEFPPILFRTDFEAGLLSRLFIDGDHRLGVLIRNDAGRTVAPLVGDYRAVRLELGNDPIQLINRTALGTISFDGFSSWTATGDLLEVDGPSPGLRAWSDSGSYLLENDGDVQINGVLAGAMTSNGDLLAWVKTSDSAPTNEVSLTIAVKTGSGLDARAADGSWTLGGLGIETSDDNRWTDYVKIEGEPLIGDFGSLTGDSLVVDTGNFGSFAGLEPFATSYRVGADGAFTTFEETFDGAISPSGTYVLGATSLTVGEASIFFGFRDCSLPFEYGQASASSAGAPSITPVGGLPYWGNGDFGVQIEQSGTGPGGVLLLIQGAPAVVPTPLLGIDLLVDLGQSVAASRSVPISGGSVLVPLPLPEPIGIQEDLNAYLQAVVLDGGSGELSATPGLRLRVVR